MRLSDFVAADRAVVPLEATTLPEAARELCARLVATGSVADEAKLRQRMDEERSEDLVAMGDRAFLLHYRTDAVTDLAVAMGTSREPLCRDLGDDEQQCAHVLLLVCAPPRLAARYLQLVSAFARFLSAPDRVEAMLAQPTAEQLVALPMLSDYELPEQLAVRDVMTLDPRTVKADTPLKEAARAMVRLGVGGLPVVDDDGLLIGMLGQREIMSHLLSSYLQGASSAPKAIQSPTQRREVRDIMTRQVLCVSPEQPLAEVASIMTHKDVDRVPVVREGRLVGFLTRGDIVRKLIGS